ncbi:MAG TPA: asparagine synthase (glutamine-hydrolyzing) [Bacteroidia bacterium]|nr:asparagine synthase (glutamine-hydrolyzing) [Bacteroidia bacterium]
MCGIACIIGGLNSGTINTMVGAMRHRGPDDNGTWTSDDLQMGMARLSIVDLSPLGHQPMFSQDGRYTIVFNGEVYNFSELKNKFLQGERFSSHTDTEVILKMYMKMGPACLQHFRGMFAILIWDRYEKKMFGARDRMGIKPLLYYRKNDAFIFASELKSLLASREVPFDINDRALADLFLYGSIQFDKSIIQGVFSVPPASYFEHVHGENELKFKQYWDYPSEINESISFEEAVETFKEIYNESVRLRMISDRKVGVFLSSGIDSASILANLRSQNVDNVKSFTIGFADKHKKYYSEAEHAAKLSKHFGYENDSVIVGFDDIKPVFNEFIMGLDQPSIDGLNTFIVSKYSRNLLTVALCGLGGDELLMGYPRNVNLYNKLNSFKPFGKLSDYYIKQRLFNGRFNNKYFSKLYQLVGGSNNLKLNYWHGKPLNSPYTLKSRFSSKLAPILNEQLISDFYHFDKATGYNSSLFNKISYYETRSYMLSQLLRDMDALSMSQSIEVRFPLLDHKLAEFIYSLPENFRYKPKTASTNFKTGQMTYEESGVKHLLAQAYKNELPADYLRTPKQGFQLPVYDWTAKIVKEDFDDILSQNYMLDYFNSGYLQQVRSGFAKTGQIDDSAYLMVIFSLWYKAMKGRLS